MDVKVESNVANVKVSLEQAKMRAAIIIGGTAEKYAKALCPVGTPESTGWTDKKGVRHPNKGYRGGTLRNSITHEISGDDIMIGTNVEYAPYVELGTGPNFTPPPEWEQFESPPSQGIGHGFVKPRPYLRPALADHLDEYKEIFESELDKATP